MQPRAGHTPIEVIFIFGGVLIFGSSLVFSFEFLGMGSPLGLALVENNKHN